MAIEFKRTAARDGQAEAEDDRRRREAERTREEFGLATLSDEEELIDDETFFDMHDRLAVGRRSGGPEAEGTDAARSGEDEAADELLLEEIATELPHGAGSTGARPDAAAPADAGAVARLERVLLDAKDRDEVVATTLGIARYYGRAAALFVVHKGVVAGLRGSGGGLENRMDGILVPTEAECVLGAPLANGRSVRVAAPFGALDQRVLRAMGREAVRHVAMFPITIGGRVVNLLYVDGGEAPLAETSLAALRVLSVGVGRVYERLILERKRAGRPARG
jgi:hypothetical protein